MIQFLLSPAKMMRLESSADWKKKSKPRFLNKSELLVEEMRKMSVQDLQDLMKISTPLAEENSERFLEWNTKPEAQKSLQAVLAFNGEVYRGLDAQSIPESHLDYLQEKLNILSGLYGVLRPLDTIMLYRLEMGRKVPLKNAKNLPDYWKKDVTETLNKKAKKGDTLINLASNEYAKAVDKKMLKPEWLDVEFLDERNGEHKKIMVYFKQARGAMARFAIDNRINDAEELKEFNGMGYAFNAPLSTNTNWVFTR